MIISSAILLMTEAGFHCSTKERKHAEAAFGARWRKFSNWVRAVDPEGRMLNPFFAGLLSVEPA